MSTREALLLGLEEVLNKVMELDPWSAEQMAALHGKIVGIQLDGLGLTMYFAADQRGRLQVLSDVEGEPDCLMRGTPLDLLTSALSEHSEDALFSGRVEITGDTDLASRFSEILSGLKIDWEEQLSRLTGDVVAHELGDRARSVGRWANRAGDISQQNLREYLQEESRVLPTRYEVEDWQGAVDVLRDDTERLAARVARLKSRIEKETVEPSGE